MAKHKKGVIIDSLELHEDGRDIAPAEAAATALINVCLYLLNLKIFAQNWKKRMMAITLLH